MKRAIEDLPDHYSLLGNRQVKIKNKLNKGNSLIRTHTGTEKHWENEGRFLSTLEKKEIWHGACQSRIAEE